MARVYKYKKLDRTNTDALRKYRDENALTNAQVAERAGETADDVSRWIGRKRVPKPVLEKLGLKARNSVSVTKKTDQETSLSRLPEGGSLYICYVGSKQRNAFLTICESLGIEAKHVL